MKITERYTRVSADFINWQITVDDPATWTKPYTFMVRLKKADGLIYEYACHEGNYAMEGILARRPHGRGEGQEEIRSLAEIDVWPIPFRLSAVLTSP